MEVSLSTQETSYLILACETLMEQCTNNFECEIQEVMQERYIKLWNLREKLNK
jgi:hypothetical protein